jgi:hypothetical protein
MLSRTAATPTFIAVISREICPALHRVNGVDLVVLTGRRRTIVRWRVKPEIADHIAAAITIQ